jgi:hypothetical protein
MPGTRYSFSWRSKSRGASDWLRAKGWWAELKELSPQEQADKVNSVAAVHRREVFETILREAKLVCGRDPYAGEHLAMTAHRGDERISDPSLGLASFPGTVFRAVSLQ